MDNLRHLNGAFTAMLIIYSIQSQILRCYWYRVQCLILITLRSLITTRESHAVCYYLYGEDRTMGWGYLL